MRVLEEIRPYVFQFERLCLALRECPSFSHCFLSLFGWTFISFLFFFFHFLFSPEMYRLSLKSPFIDVVTIGRSSTQAHHDDRSRSHKSASRRDHHSRAHKSIIEEKSSTFAILTTAWRFLFVATPAQTVLDFVFDDRTRNHMDRLDQPWNMPRKCKFCDNEDSNVPTIEKRLNIRGGLFSLCQ